MALDNAGQSVKSIAMRAFKRRRRRMLITWLLTLAVFACCAVAQRPDADSDGRPSGNLPPSTGSSSQYVDATSKPVALVESVQISTTLNVTSNVPAQFYLAAPFTNSSNPLYTSVSLCSGPAIPPYNTTDPAVLSELGMSSYDASLTTLVRMYVSTNQINKSPGPDNLAGLPDVQYLLGGFARDQAIAKTADGAWISIWPPSDTRNVTGQWTLNIIASTEGQPATLINTPGITFDDSDARSALLTSYAYDMTQKPNLTLYVLPTFGTDSLPNGDYFNSSYCSIVNSFADFNSTSNRDQPQINSSITQRGLQWFQKSTQQRQQWQITNLDRDTNYTAWLFHYGTMGVSAAVNASIYPAVKFTTKKSSNCRLVYNVDFCPQVAYSIPVSPDISTLQALNIINATVSPNFINFSATVDTFPCDSNKFGQYSPIQGCQDCKDRYQDWLCAVTMPRCVDPIPGRSFSNLSAAITDPLSLNGQQMETSLTPLPYIVNRDQDSRQAYIDDPNGLDAGVYGELLPCIYNCYFVSRSCPTPLIQWNCPIWDISAQCDYGTFADLAINSDAGPQGQNWGGPTRYIAQDAFGNAYCNSLGSELLLRQTNTAFSTSILGSLTTLFSISTILAMVFL